METVTLMVKGTKKEYPKGSTYFEISKDMQPKYENDIILVLENGRLRELSNEAKDNVKVEFITTAHPDGFKTYCRGMIMMLVKSIYHIVGQEKIEKVSMEHSLGAGFYGTIQGDVAVTQKLLDEVADWMRKLVEADYPFKKYTIHTSQARKKFHDYRMYDKEKLFRYRRTSATNIYNLDGFEDYYFGYMPASTGVLKYFQLYEHEGGFILQLPTKKNPKEVPPFVPMEKLFQTLRVATEWGKTLGIENVGSLNDVIAEGDISDLMLVQEALQEKKIGEIAEQIAKQRDKKFIMIAGPSSSGKTTFSHRLSIQLRTFGLKPHPIAVDDYFVNREDTPLNEDGTYNFECLEAIDVEQFNKDMMALLNGETVELPTFNFKTGKREYKGRYKKLGKDDILVIEGIHGLNDKLSYSLPSKSKFKIYISALTALNVDEHNQISTSDARLIRRMVRDARTRGTSASSTIAMWKSVRAGEEKYIFPFQESADVMFNSALIYELAVLKQYAEPILFGINEDDPSYMEAKRILKFLDYFVGVNSEDVPKNSIIREFIGNSYFHV
ncbi:nucleoside kinase [Velocimicrobium porci]|uniref:Nucleoside kinase n=1 Tax=Velocimicrobium porci TaxID=2606634 RepID=A0A6L5XV30_9FIRM|nr:nucleoside kinase [Velocimicrobium porci]MSS62459.1 nucleoside kinase [Velocimicrobium porci]